jgi:hypothetical protein
MTDERPVGSARFRARFFHDWTSGWLWADNVVTRRAFGYDIDHHGIGLSRPLSDELDRLAVWHDASPNTTNPDWPSLWRQPECDDFNRAVYAALDRLRAELGPSWSIVDEMHALREDPDLGRYLADPSRFARRR